MRQAEDLEAAAMTSWFETAEPALRERLGLSVHTCGGARVFRARAVPHVYLNRAMGFGRETPEESPLLSVLGRFRAQAIPHYLLHVPAPTPAPLLSVLGQEGLVPFSRRWVTLMRQAGPLPQTETQLAIGRAEGHESEAFARVLATSLDLPAEIQPLYAAVVNQPAWHAFVARDGTSVVAAGLMFVRGRMAYLTGGATLPSHRRRGAQLGLLVHRLHAAFRLGCTSIYSSTGEPRPGEPSPSFDNMRRCGLQPVGLHDNWSPRGSRWSPSTPAAGE